jgi:hypothetical protein
MYAQITVNECIENGLKHRPSIKTAQADLAVAALKVWMLNLSFYLKLP